MYVSYFCVYSMMQNTGYNIRTRLCRDGSCLANNPFVTYINVAMRTDRQNVGTISQTTAIHFYLGYGILVPTTVFLVTELIEDELWVHESLLNSQDMMYLE